MHCDTLMPAGQQMPQHMIGPQIHTAIAALDSDPNRIKIGPVPNTDWPDAEITHDNFRVVKIDDAVLHGHWPTGHQRTFNINIAIHGMQVWRGDRIRWNNLMTWTNGKHAHQWLSLPLPADLSKETVDWDGSHIAICDIYGRAQSPA